MDFINSVKAFAAKVPDKLDIIKTEEATKQFLIIPFIQNILGYDTSNPHEVMPEYDANVGAANNYKLDYAIFQDCKPAILIECKRYGNDLENDKEWSQLFHYFVATEARIGVLTNGVIYKFYADLEKPNKMDKIPFLELNLLSLTDSSIKELSKLNKSEFDVDAAMNSAAELKYVGGMKALLKQQMESPSDEFVKYFFKELCPDNKYVGRLKEDFRGYMTRAIEEFIREEIETLLDEAVRPKPKPNPEPELETELEIKPRTEFTEDERQGYYVLQAILSAVVKPSRVTYKDTVEYCNILLDNNVRRQIVRFYFNNPERKKLEIYSINDDGKKITEKFPINDLKEIYQYADKFKAIVAAYEQKMVVK